MQVQEILTAAIVFIPAAYALYIAVQFASGLARLGSRSIAPVTAPIATVGTQQAATDATDEVTQADPWTIPCTLAEATVAAPPAGDCDQAKPIALLPAFIPAVQVEATADDHALVEGAWMRLYCTAGVDDVVVPFTRPLSAVQKPQQAHPAIEGMTLRAMRELGATLKIKGCRRWNTQQAIEQLTHYYSSNAA